MRAEGRSRAAEAEESWSGGAEGARAAGEDAGEAADAAGAGRAGGDRAQGQGQEAGAGRARGGDEAERASTERAETLGSVVLDGETGHSVDRPERDQAYDATSEAEDAAAASALSAHVPGARQCCRGDERRCGEERCCVAMPRRGGHAGQDAGGGSAGPAPCATSFRSLLGAAGPGKSRGEAGEGGRGESAGGAQGSAGASGGAFPPASEDAGPGAPAGNKNGDAGAGERPGRPRRRAGGDAWASGFPGHGGPGGAGMSLDPNATAGLASLLEAHRFQGQCTVPHFKARLRCHDLAVPEAAGDPAPEAPPGAPLGSRYGGGGRAGGLSRLARQRQQQRMSTLPAFVPPETEEGSATGPNGEEAELMSVEVRSGADLWEALGQVRDRIAAAFGTRALSANRAGGAGEAAPGARSRAHGAAARAGAPRQESRHMEDSRQAAGAPPRRSASAPRSSGGARRKGSGGCSEGGSSSFVREAPPACIPQGAAAEMYRALLAMRRASPPQDAPPDPSVRERPPLHEAGAAVGASQSAAQSAPPAGEGAGQLGPSQSRGPPDAGGGEFPTEAGRRSAGGPPAKTREHAAEAGASGPAASAVGEESLLTTVGEVWDADRDGALSGAELDAVLAAHGVPAEEAQGGPEPGGPPAQTGGGILARFDADGDRRLDAREMQQWEEGSQQLWETFAAGRAGHLLRRRIGANSTAGILGYIPWVGERAGITHGGNAPSGTVRAALPSMAVDEAMAAAV